ncbi:protein of unknown function [Methylorubrum extorquens]|uniref:Uncharacterized protein n=1 Tax=Methylorubrum extorquens TaxID=408 RepID=A0A2N9AXA5_METEX|nr:protein of unknown function [Methylorubrum extorquens]
MPGLALDMRYAGSDNFVGRPIAGYEAPRCLLTPAGRRRAGPGAGVAGAGRPRPEGVRLLPPAPGRGRLRHLGARPGRHTHEGGLLPADGQGGSVPPRLHR